MPPRRLASRPREMGSIVAVWYGSGNIKVYVYVLCIYIYIYIICFCIEIIKNNKVYTEIRSYIFIHIYILRTLSILYTQHDGDITCTSSLGQSFAEVSLVRSFIVS